MSSSSSLHLATYIIPALLLSIILNIPKFLEAELVRANIEHDKVLENLNKYMMKYLVKV